MEARAKKYYSRVAWPAIIQHNTIQLDSPSFSSFSSSTIRCTSMNLSKLSLAASLAGTASANKTIPQSQLRPRVVKTRGNGGEEPLIEGIVNDRDDESKKPEYLVSLGTVGTTTIEALPGYNIDYQFFFHKCGGSLISPYLVLTAARKFLQRTIYFPFALLIM